MKYLSYCAALGAIAIASVTSPPVAPATRCKLFLKHADRDFVRTSPFNNDVNVNYDVAGHVHLQCIGQQIFLDADSVSVKSEDYAHLYGHVVYWDSAYRFAADTMLYLIGKEVLQARGNVHVLDKAAGSTLDGPWVDYYRQVKGVRDSAEINALLRPTVHYFNKPAIGDTTKQHPYILIGTHLKGFGQSRLTADSAVTLDRDSLHARSDSISVERGKVSIVQLIGKPATVRQAGRDSMNVAGREIRFRLEDDKLREMRSFLDASVLRGGTLVTGDTVLLSFTLEKLGLTLAWNRKLGATIHSEGYDVVGDSLAVETPGEQLKEIRIFNHGMIQNPRDTTVHQSPRFPGDTAKPDSIRNTLWGERITAKFDQLDSAGTQVTRLRGLQAYGKGMLQARSLFKRLVTKDGKTTPSVNYTLADTILMRLKGGDSTGVAAVQAYGHVDGVQLETVTISKPKVADSGKTAPPTGRP